MDRLITALTELVRGLVADLFYAKTTSYSVVACNKITQTVSLRSLDKSVSDLTNVPIGGNGWLYDLPPGTQVKVSYAGSQPYVSGLSSGGIPPIIPVTGSGLLNEIDAGYVLIVQTPALALSAVYFPAGLTGGVAAETARLAAVAAGNVAFLLHMTGGRVLPDAWTIP
jgi:hypothetical protein